MESGYRSFLSFICVLSLLMFTFFCYGCGDGLDVLTEKNTNSEDIIIEKEYISGEITTNTTLSPEVEVTGDLIVNGATLTIEPGTAIEMSAENDNVVYGNTANIAIVAINDGSIQANGTETDPILFTSSSENPAGADWGHIQLINNGTNSSFTYCIFEYAFNAICIENPAGITGSSSPVIDHVTVRHMSGVGIYATDASNVYVTNSVIYDCNSGIFFHGVATTGILNTLIYDVSTGIILPGDAAKSSMNVTIDHITIYNIDSALTSSPTWWTGYGIYTCNDAGVLTLTNSIISEPTDYGLYCGAAWAITENYNCFFGGIGAKENGGAIGASSIEQDPVFTDANAHDFTLDSSSPCINAASDGFNMGVN